MSFYLFVGVSIAVVVVSVFISIYLRAQIRVQSLTDRNELQQNISRQTSDLQNIFTPQLETLITQQQGHLKELREGNEKQLEEIRKTVDEKLHDELNKRLDSGFEKVQGFLMQIGKGLGEMRQMSAEVGNLQRVLSNVKKRGGLGEVQLEAILEDYLAPHQYEKNKVTVPGSKAHVEFAVRMPGLQDQAETFMPIDSKFPLEDYYKLQDAQERNDKNDIKEARKALGAAVENSAKEIREKYISPPHTTDIGILFLPTEGLYAEVLRTPDVIENLQKHRINLAGPTTLTMMLSAFQLGFQTLAIEKRSTEVWAVLGATRTEFSKFGAWLDKIQDQVTTVQNSLDKGATRTRVMNRALDSVDALPEEQAEEVFSSHVNELANEIEHEDS